MEGSRDRENVEKELKPIRYQSETYSKVTRVINRVMSLVCGMLTSIRNAEKRSASTVWTRKLTKKVW